ncbi:MULTISPECIES: hypothetical protein [Streptomyces]|uniref:Adenylate cyclase n=5 Tax=Streptomyces TaxID=1883 RepID=A0ABU2WC92_9ACTN|nr:MULTISPECIES: hypothetical protein [Streptomyces]MDT0495115.1 hypothetical protein [Streptomyces griseus]GGZ81352.1 hypothetical protein GCM10010328_64950 [Streptomyces pluricolorescens]
MLQFSDTQFAQIRIDSTRVSLSPGFDVHRLTIPAELQPTGLEHNLLCEVEAEVSAASPSSRWIATAKPTRVRLTNHNHTSVRLAFPVTNQQLLDLEEHRAGHDLLLELHLSGFIQYDHSSAESREHVRVPASVWQDELERLGAAFGFALSIPLPISAGARRDAATYLQNARRLLHDGEFDKAIGSARQAMERILAVADWPQISKNDDLHQRSQAQRWRAIYKAVFDQASGAEHADEVTKDFSYSRGEAEALIGIVASLLRTVPASSV